MRPRVQRLPFDSRYEFVAVPPAGRTFIIIGGVRLLAGEQVDKGRVTARCLKQMYDAARIIAVAPGQTPFAPKPRPRAVGRPDSAGEPTPKRVVRRRLMRAA